MPHEMKGRVALVTGASRGLGRAMSVALGELGMSVAVNYVSRPDAAAETVELVRRAGGSAGAFAADASDATQVRHLVETVTRQIGPIDVLVNNAGIGPIVDVFEQTEAEWRSVMRANLDSAFIVTQSVIGGMRDRRFGRLVFMSSLAAHSGGVISPAYAASKAGLEGMMHFYAAHLLKYRITANAIAPAFVESEMTAAFSMPPLEQVPLQRMGRPDEVGNTLKMIVTTEYMTGQTIHLNAGRLHT
jgi:3-oxoacyl-[acyl-carrier protein] reductase